MGIKTTKDGQFELSGPTGPWWLFWLVIILFFAGDPDLMDAIVDWLRRH